MPGVLAPSHARQMDAGKQHAARNEPAVLLKQMIAAQRCNRPDETQSGAHSAHHFAGFGEPVRQDGIPSLRVRVHLEPDPRDPCCGDAVFQLWTWKAS
mmetsp:Transcript_35773/g.91337  ORF Transcript_35773/g.91337 Transcript_35773/m.91337 type:complete len:98 (-) Transcript_35773:528-821(-)